MTREERDLMIAEAGKPYHFKKGNKLQERKRGMKYNVRKEINKFLETIPQGQKPWERLHQIGNADPNEVSVEAQLQANKTLGAWGLDDGKDEAVNITAQHINVENIDNLLLKRLGMAQEEQADSEGDTTQDEQSIST